MTRPQESSIERPTYASLAVAAQGEAARWNVPGMTAAVMHNGRRTATATGVTNLQYPAPVTVDTRFQVGSITKLITATAVMALVDRGELDLDTPVTQWVKDVPLKRQSVLQTLTLRHLLNHTTGFEGDVFFDTGNGDDALAKGIAQFDRIRQWTVPGEVFAYCNAGFYLAGRVIAKVTGQPFENAVQTLVVKPLDMKQTSFPSPDLITVPPASGHTMKERHLGYDVYRPWALPRVVNAAGGIVSTVDDLLTFAEMHMGSGRAGETQLLTATSASVMRKRTSKSGVLDGGFGIGWNITHIDGVAVVGHGGATNGFRAALVTVPERQFALAMLSNGDGGAVAMQEIQRWALRHHLDLEAPQRELVDARDDTFDSVTGHYQRHDAGIYVWRVDDELHIERTIIEHEDQFSHQRRDTDPPTVTKAAPTGENVFRVVSGPTRDALIEFFDADLFGEGDELVSKRLMHSGGRLAERVGDAPASGPTAPIPRSGS